MGAEFWRTGRGGECDARYVLQRETGVLQGRAKRSRYCFDVTKAARGVVTSNALRVKEPETSNGQAEGGSRL